MNQLFKSWMVVPCATAVATATLAATHDPGCTVILFAVSGIIGIAHAYGGTE